MRLMWRIGSTANFTSPRRKRAIHPRHEHLALSSSPTLAKQVKGRETEILDALGIAWMGSRGHIDNPYSDRGGRADWRWDQAKTAAFCICIGSRPGEKKNHSILWSCPLKRLTSTLPICVVEILGRTDLIREKGGGQEHQCMTAAALLHPPADKRDDSLPPFYLASWLLGVSVPDAPHPRTKMVG